MLQAGGGGNPADRRKGKGRQCQQRGEVLYEEAYEEEGERTEFHSNGITVFIRTAKTVDRHHEAGKLGRGSLLVPLQEKGRWQIQASVQFDCDDIEMELEVQPASPSANHQGAIPRSPETPTKINLLSQDGRRFVPFQLESIAGPGKLLFQMEPEDDAEVLSVLSWIRDELPPRFPRGWADAGSEQPACWQGETWLSLSTSRDQETGRNQPLWKRRSLVQLTRNEMRPEQEQRTMSPPPRPHKIPRSETKVFAEIRFDIRAYAARPFPAAEGPSPRTTNPVVKEAPADDEALSQYRQAAAPEEEADTVASSCGSRETPNLVDLDEATSSFVGGAAGGEEEAVDPPSSLGGGAGRSGFGQLPDLNATPPRDPS